MHHRCKYYIFDVMPNFIKKVNLDFLGMITSIACAIHCAVLPLLITSLPLFGINILRNSSFEWMMIGLAFAVGCFALAHGYRLHHSNLKPFYMFSVGFIFLIIKQIASNYEFLFLLPALCFIVFAHVLNFRYCKRSSSYALKNE